VYLLVGRDASPYRHIFGTSSSTLTNYFRERNRCPGPMGLVYRGVMILASGLIRQRNVRGQSTLTEGDWSYANFAKRFFRNWPKRGWGNAQSMD